MSLTKQNLLHLQLGSVNAFISFQASSFTRHLQRIRRSVTTRLAIHTRFRQIFDTLLGYNLSVVWKNLSRLEMVRNISLQMVVETTMLKARCTLCDIKSCHLADFKQWISPGLQRKKTPISTICRYVTVFFCCCYSLFSETIFPNAFVGFNNKKHGFAHLIACQSSHIKRADWSKSL